MIALKGPGRYEVTTVIGKTTYRHVTSTLTDAKAAEVKLVKLRKNMVDYTRLVMGVKDNPLHTVLGTSALIHIEPGVKMKVDLDNENNIDNYVRTCLKAVGYEHGLMAGVFSRVINNKIFYLISDVFTFTRAINSKYAGSSNPKLDMVNVSLGNLEDIGKFNVRYPTIFKSEMA